MWGKIWQKLKRWLVRKLVTEPHSAFLHGRRSGTTVQLKFVTTIDAPLFIETRIVHHLVRPDRSGLFSELQGEGGRNQRTL